MAIPKGGGAGGARRGGGGQRRHGLSKMFAWLTPHRTGVWCSHDDVFLGGRGG